MARSNEALVVNYLMCTKEARVVSDALHTHFGFEARVDIKILLRLKAGFAPAQVSIW